MSRVLGVVLVALIGAVLAAVPAAAHPLDETVQQLYLTPSRSGLGVQLEISPNVLVAGAFARGVDTDTDGVLSPAETDGHVAAVRSALTVLVDDRPADLRVVEATYPPLDLLAAGGGTIALSWTADLPPTAQSIRVTDTYDPGRTIVQAAVLQPAGPLPVAHIGHADGGRTLTAALNGGPDPAPDAPTAAVVGNTATTTDAGMFEALRRPLTSPWALGELLGLCALLGALHALTPGHGKTLLAAYLVEERGTARHAVGLGLVTTFTHTASVLVLGTLVLVAGQFVVPGVVVPVLTLAAGITVLVLGLRLVRRRRHAAVGHEAHGHGHGHSGEEGHGAVLTKAPRRVAAMGVSAGMIPCPEALGVLLLAVGVGRTALGLTMIVAFSVGLAAVLVGLGLLLVTLGPRLPRPGGPRTRWLVTRLPLVSAVVVAGLGVVMTVSGVLTLVG